MTRVNIARGAQVIKTRSTERAGLPEQDPRVQVYDARQIGAVVDAPAERARRRPRATGTATRACATRSSPACARSSTGTFASATLDLMRRRGTFLTPTVSAVIDLAAPGGRVHRPAARSSAGARCWPRCA